MDYGHAQTDKELKKLENRITNEYWKSYRDMRAKTIDYLDKYKAKDKVKRQQVANGTISKQEYNDWKIGQIMTSERYAELRDSLSADCRNAANIAASMINGFTPDVYALNHNYGTFEVEKGSMLDTSYTLYDRNTVYRLIKDRPDLLPKAKVDIQRTEKWSKVKIDSAITQGILQGESMEGIAKRLREVTDMNRAASIRNARTMTTAAENGGRQDSYKRAEKMGIELENQWVATLDGRTRHSHRMLDGETRKVGEEFSNGCEYPGDPAGEPEEVYNCRCTLIAQVKGINYDLADVSHLNGKLGNMTYDEWKYGHEVQKEEPPVKAEEEKTLKSVYDRVKRRIKNNAYVSEKDLKEVGEQIANEYENYLSNMINSPENKAKISELEEQELNLIMKASDAVTNKENALERFKRGEITGQEYRKFIQKKMEAEKELEKIRDRIELLQSGRMAPEDSAQWLKEELSKVRSMGSDGFDVKSHLRNSRSPVAKNVEYAYNLYPSDWVEASIARNQMSVRKVDRGYYGGGEICISGWSERDFNETAIHELGHRFEDSVRGIRSAEKEFYNRRTEGEELSWMGAGYGRNEVTRRDDFLHSYMGKDYGGHFYELVSMGFEYAYTDPIHLAKDRDMQTWIYGILALL